MSDIITGNLPITFNSVNNGSEIDYIVYGTENGAGVETGNLFDKNAKDPDNGFEGNRYINIDGTTIANQNFQVSEYIAASEQTTYYLYSFVNTGVNTAMCFYDENKTFISSTKILNKTSVVSPEGTYFLRITVQKSIADTATLTTTALPSSYIPFGYQIPLTIASGVTENLFDSEIEQGNMYAGADQPSTSENYYKRCRTAGFINVEQDVTYTCKSSYNMWCYTYKNGVYYSRQGSRDWATTFTITPDSNFNQIRIMFANLDTTETLDISDFVNDVMLVEGSTPPDHYIPHRYTSDYSLYIGDTKLDEEEYVDYESGKVWKRTENLFDGTLLNGYFTSANFVRGSTSSTVYKSLKIYLEAGTYTIAAFNANVKSIRKIIDDQYAAVNNSLPITFTVSQDGFVGLSLRKDDSTSWNDNIGITIVSGSTTPQTYIPYLQPTDPPVLLPKILTYQGENTLSSTETLGEVTIKYNILKEIFQIYTNNQLYDLCDSNFYNQIAEEYNTLKAYKEGDACIYNHKLYKCLYETDGNWDQFAWEEDTIGDLIQGDGQEVSIKDDDWELINEISQYGGLSGDFKTDYKSLAPGRFMYCSMDTVELINCSQVLTWTFYNCKNLSFISASNCTYIGAYAFRACDTLLSYNLSNVETLGTGAFMSCIALSKANFSQCLTIGSQAFSGCTVLDEVNMPVVSIIYSDAFSGCTALTTLELPGCLSIYSYALRNCTKLETASFPNLVRIYSSGFANCQKLMSLYLLSTKMCTLQNANAFDSTPIATSVSGIYGSIYVPSNLVDSYKVATGWTTYSNRIVAYEE